jgi:ABC-type multidrug transport system fused ATPase/permease subunit
MRRCSAQGSIRDNIAYGCLDATDEQIVEAASAANAMVFIKKAPAGFRTMVSASKPPWQPTSKPSSF